MSDQDLIEKAFPQQPNYYAVIPASVRYDKRLTANAKLLYGEITALSNQSGICWASNKYFADLYSVDERSISRWVDDLSKANHIRISIESTKSGSQREIIITHRTKKSKGGIDKNVGGSRQKCPHPPDKNVHTPHPENPVQSSDSQEVTSVETAANTTFNTTLNNIPDGSFGLMKKEFMNEYMNKTEQEYYWTAKDAKHLKDLQAKISKSLRDKNQRDPTAEELAAAFKYMLSKLPEWYREKGMSVSVINSNYNQIILQIKTNNASNQSVRTSKEAKRNVSDKEYSPV